MFRHVFITPEKLDKFLGRKFVFVVQINVRNVKGDSSVYLVNKMMDDEDLVNLYSGASYGLQSLERDIESNNSASDSLRSYIWHYVYTCLFFFLIINFPLSWRLMAHLFDNGSGIPQDLRKASFHEWIARSVFRFSRCQKTGKRVQQHTNGNDIKPNRLLINVTAEERGLMDKIDLLDLKKWLF